MSHDLLRFFHLLGAMGLTAGLTGVLVSELRARRAPTLAVRRETLALVTLFYDRVVLPGALLLGVSGGVMVALTYGAGAFSVPWLTAMIVLFTLEFVEGNSITRIAFRRLRRLSAREEASDETAALERARSAWLPRFTHFLDLPMVVVILGLGVLRPVVWPPIVAAVVGAVAVAMVLTWAVPRLAPWREIGREIGREVAQG